MGRLWLAILALSTSQLTFSELVFAQTLEERLKKLEEAIEQ